MQARRCNTSRGRRYAVLPECVYYSLVTTDSPNDTSHSSPPHQTRLWWLVVLFLGALAVRIWRLDWQPLWWDEGYSVYFATEPLGRMLWLTAHDIHPPLYYALLHAWIALFGGAAPVTVRMLSVLLGAASIPALFVLGRRLFPERLRVAWLGALLLIISPMALFYSQEVRMYALALLLGILASLAFASAIRPAATRNSPWLACLLYWLFGTLLLYALYYGALLLLAHALSLLWLYWKARKDGHPAPPWGRLVAVWAAMLLAYLPWLLYALPKLIPYVQQKVASDQDTPLNPLAFLTRHLNTFLAGHVLDRIGVTGWAALLGVVGVLLLVVLLGLTTRRNVAAPLSGPAWAHQPLHWHPVALLTMWCVIPMLCAWLISLASPFLPEGGERLLLVILPYFLLLIAWAADRVMRVFRTAGALVFALIALSGVAGVFVFYTTPRYTAEDYRPLLADVVRLGRDDDTLIATFPWQVGYWRAYAPQEIAGPRVHLLDDFALEWGVPVETALANALDRGTVWFPEPLAFGSTLPQEMEAWLARNSANVENRWYSLTTRLTAWMRPWGFAASQQSMPGADSPLAFATIGSTSVPADNTPLPIELRWHAAQLADQSLGATIRLLDDSGRVWASRDYAPIGVFGAPAEDDASLIVEPLALPVGAGIPPGKYRVQVGVLDAGSSLPLNTDPDDKSVEIGEVVVTLPDTLPALARLPMGEAMDSPSPQTGMTIVGLTIPLTGTLAGDQLDLVLFIRADEPVSDRRVALTLEGAAGSTEWQGWSLTDYPTSQWTPGYVIALPIAMMLPPSLPTGEYRLHVQWLDQGGSPVSESTSLGNVPIVRRGASFLPTSPAVMLDAPAQFGTHALLRGYSLDQDADTLTLVLDWEVLQPILPPHEIFVHLDDDSSSTPVTIAQRDGAPVSASGPAPTGSWQPGEYLTTLHTVVLPDDELPADLKVRVGLFNPETLVRLPVSVGSAVTGDHVEIPLP